MPVQKLANRREIVILDGFKREHGFLTSDTECGGALFEVLFPIRRLDSDPSQQQRIRIGAIDASLGRDRGIESSVAYRIERGSDVAHPPVRIAEVSNGTIQTRFDTVARSRDLGVELLPRPKRG